MKYCSKCGKELKEGEVCDCSKNKKDVFGDVIDIFKNIIVKPIDVIKKYVIDEKFVVGIVLIVLAAIVRGLYSSVIARYSFSGLLKPDYFGKFFDTFCFCAIRYAVIVFAIYIVFNNIFKKTVSLKKIVVAVGLSLVVVIFGYVINSILTYVRIEGVSYVISFVSSFISFFNAVILYEAVKHLTDLDNNKLIMALTSVLAVTSIIMDIVNRILI